jgi:hypothetical protein
MESYYESVGAVHLHSDFSDGTLPIPEIARIAGELDLDFLMFTDHNTLEPKRRGLEGWYGRTLVLIGCELNDPDDRNHYLAFQIRNEIPKGLRATAYVRRVCGQRGFGVIAHPAEKRNFSDAYPPYPWTDWDVKGFDGIEIWNQMSEWLEGVTKRNIYWRILHPLRSIRFPVWTTLNRWDSLNRKKRIVGVGGIDVHAYKLKLLGLFSLEIYPYKVQFKSIRMHLLTRQPLKREGNPLPFPKAEKAAFEALKSGRAFITNYSLGDGRGFRFWAERGSVKLPMGSRFPESGFVCFHAEAPLPGRIRLLCDGRLVHETVGKSLQYKTRAPGVYRIEIFRKSRGWIYSNPIVMTERKQK